MKHVLYIIMAVLLMNCGNSKSYTKQEQQAYQELKAMVAAQNFEIESDFARPMVTTAFMQVANTNILGPGNSASQIDINNNSNKFTVKGDTISGYFPYFGEQQFGGGYPGTNHQGIEFKDVPENYKMTVNDDKHTVNINFIMEDQYRNNERYNIYVTLFPNKRSTIQINSTNRTSIQYSGQFKALESQKE